MRVIARKAAVLFALASCVALFGFADAHTEVMDLFGSMTAALADDNVPGFMSGFDKNMPQYETLHAYLDALVGAAEVTSAMEPLKDEGDDQKRSVDLDWTMQIRSRVAAGPMVERHQTVHAELVKQKKHWRVASISPLEFFAPAKFTESK